MSFERINDDGFFFHHRAESDPSVSALNQSHCHDKYEILFIISGEGRYLLEGSSFNIIPGSLIFIRPFEYHSLALDPSKTYERFVINFSKSFLMDDVSEMLDDFLETDNVGGRLYTSSALTEVFLSLFSRFSLASTMEPARKKTFVKLLLSELVLLLTVSKSECLINDEEELGARVIKYLNENISRDLTLDHLAKRFFVSKYYLCRAFKNHNGISVHGYINQKRVMYAKQLIASGESASAAAYRVGFGDYTSFYRAYLKLIGKAPTASDR